MSELEGTRTRGAGGTSGGLTQFFAGAAMVGVGGWLLLNQVTVTTGFWRLWGGQSAFGLSLLPLLAGIAVLFFNGRSTLGWLLTVIGAGIILLGVLMHLDFYFRPTSLFNTLVMLGLLAGGLGLVARSLRPL
jgi:uncharacterized protein